MRNKKIIVEAKGSVEEELIRVARILKRLRESTKHWENQYGAAARGIKKEWEAKADEWVAEHIKSDDQ